ncbi:hypothetical protein BDW69DRAFT_189554 [Aspergillus filifer]
MMDTRTPNGEPMSAKRIRTELFVIMSAGTDGSVTAASGVIVGVMSQPALFDRVVTETKMAALEGKLSQLVPTYNETFSLALSELLTLSWSLMGEYFR